MKSLTKYRIKIVLASTVLFFLGVAIMPVVGVALMVVGSVTVAKKVFKKPEGDTHAYEEYIPEQETSGVQQDVQETQQEWERRPVHQHPPRQ